MENPVASSPAKSCAPELLEKLDQMFKNLGKLDGSKLLSLVKELPLRGFKKIESSNKVSQIIEHLRRKKQIEESDIFHSLKDIDIEKKINVDSLETLDCLKYFRWVKFVSFSGSTMKELTPSKLLSRIEKLGIKEFHTVEIKSCIFKGKKDERGENGNEIEHELKQLSLSEQREPISELKINGCKFIDKDGIINLLDWAVLSPFKKFTLKKLYIEEEWWKHLVTAIETKKADGVLKLEVMEIENCTPEISGKLRERARRFLS